MFARSTPAVAITFVGAAGTVATAIGAIVNDFVPLPTESVAVMVNVFEVVDVGVPEITPVEELRIRPTGNVPVVTEKLVTAGKETI